MSNEKAGKRNPDASRLKARLGELWRAYQEIESLQSRLRSLFNRVDHHEDKLMEGDKGAYVGFLDPFEPNVVAVVDEDSIKFWSLTNLEEEEDDISR